VSHAETQRAHVEAARAHLREDGLGEQRELLRPGRGGRSHDEHAALDPHRPRARSDARPHGRLPVALGDRRRLDRGWDAQITPALKDEPKGLNAYRHARVLHRCGPICRIAKVSPVLVRVQA